MRLKKPGPRKEAICALVPRCDTAAEIGADHGIISAHLLKGGTAGRMIVSDISAASLGKARRLFSRHGLQGRTEFVVADGLDALSRPVDAIVIAGMGGHTIAGILQAGAARIHGAALILQPNSDVDALRRWLAGHGFCLGDERLAREGRRYYVVMQARRGPAAYSGQALLLGPCLMRERPPFWGEYLAWRRDCLLRSREEGAAEKIAYIEEAMRDAERHGGGCVPDSG